MTAENIKFAESFGAARNADGTFTLTADALSHLIESAKNWGKYDESWAMPAGFAYVPNAGAEADFDDNQICGGIRL